MSDAWQEIQLIKSKRNELRERLQKRRKEREDLLGGTEASSSPNLGKTVSNGSSVILVIIVIKN